MQVLHPKRRIFQPTFDWISKDVFDVLVYKSSPESSRFCSPQDRPYRFNQLAIEDFQLLRIALESGLGELLLQECNDRQKQSTSEYHQQTKCPQAWGFILSKQFEYPDGGHRHHHGHGQ